MCRPGGQIGLANWTPNGFVGQMFKVIGKYVPPAPGAASPARWGTREFLLEAFPAPQARVRCTAREFTFRYRSPEHFIDVFRTFYGPMNKAFASLAADPPRQAAFNAELLALLAANNRAADGTLVVPSEYLEVVVHKA